MAIERNHKLRKFGSRRQSGAAMLLLVILFIAGLTSATVAGAAMLQYVGETRQAEAAAEAASLAAARELSSVVVLDPNYGYIALSDYAPSSCALVADDGKPLPVTGINTLLATARTSMLVAKNLNNEEYLRLARLDASRTRAAARRLVVALKLALKEDSRAPLNKDGRPVRPVKAAREAFLRTLKGRGESFLRELNLELGYSSSGTTNTAVPVPTSLGEVPALANNAGFYAAFVDLPVAGESFIFADVSKQPRLVARDQFVADKTSIASGDDIELLERFIPASIVRVRARVEDKNTAAPFNYGGSINGCACAAPFALSDRSAAGVMIVGLPDGAPVGYLSLLDYINDPRSSCTNLTMFRARGGDYPLDSEAQLACDQGQTLANLFVQGLYDWVRTAHGRFDLSQLLSVVGSRMQPSSGSYAAGQSLVYRFDKTGLVVDSYNVADVPNQIVHDKQSYTLGLGALQSNNARWTIAFRDQVRHLGPAAGGKHGGQLMEIDGCLRPVGSLYSKALSSCHGQGERKTYFDGGLAVEFVISSPQAI